MALLLYLFYVSEVYVIFPESDICRKYDGKGSGRGEESVSFTSFNIALTLSTMVFRAVINAHENFILKGAETVELVLQPLWLYWYYGNIQVRFL